jgi:hypothetical protein
LKKVVEKVVTTSPTVNGPVGMTFRDDGAAFLVPV